MPLLERNSLCFDLPSHLKPVMCDSSQRRWMSTRSWSGRLAASSVEYAQEMKRCLFVFAKLNPGLRYVQGMNELLAPLYYHFRTDPAPGVAEHAEADAFYCFMDLLAEFRDHFCQQLVRRMPEQDCLHAGLGRVHLPVPGYLGLNLGRCGARGRRCLLLLHGPAGRVPVPLLPAAGAPHAGAQV